MQKRESNRILGLDILRAFAIGAVILIHTISGGLYNISWSEPSFKLYLFLDQLSRFSVPLFVFLSGLTLTLRYKQSVIGAGEFFRRRLLRLLPWYFFWSAVLFFYIKFATEEVNPFPLWKVIFLGKADYHLYFVPMIFSMYLVFPLLLRAVRARPGFFAVSVFGLQVVFYEVLTRFSQGKLVLPIFLNDQQQYLFLGTWIFYFVLGIYVALKSEILSFFKKYFWVLAICTLAGLAWETVGTFHLAHALSNLTVATRSTRIPVLVYASFSLLFLFTLSNYLGFLPLKIYDGLVRIGQRSYVIYLAHTLVLRVFSTYIRPASLFWTLVLFVMVFSVSNYLAKLCLAVAGFTHSKILYRRTEEI